MASRSNEPTPEKISHATEDQMLNAKKYERNTKIMNIMMNLCDQNGNKMLADEQKPIEDIDKCLAVLDLQIRTLRKVTPEWPHYNTIRQALTKFEEYHSGFTELKEGRQKWSFKELAKANAAAKDRGGLSPEEIQGFITGMEKFIEDRIKVDKKYKGRSNSLVLLPLPLDVAMSLTQDEIELWTRGYPEPRDDSNRRLHGLDEIKIAAQKEMLAQKIDVDDDGELKPE